MEFINNICQTWQNLHGDTFASGMYLAAVLVTVLLLVYIILRLLIWGVSRRCKVNKVIISGQNGDIVIAESAIIDTVRSVIQNFSEIEAGKIRISRKRKSYAMELHICFHPGKTSLSDACEELRTKIKERLDQRLHITQLDRIDIRLDRLADEVCEE